MNPEQPSPKLQKTWQEALKALLIRALGQTSGGHLWQKYQSAFLPDYQTLISPRNALQDILQLEHLLASRLDGIKLLKPQATHLHYRLHFYSLQERYLDEFMPVLENLHLRVMDQVQFTFVLEGVTATIKSFTINAVTPQCAPLGRLKNPLLATIQAVIAKQVENDALNKLCVLVGMHWQPIDVLRAYRSYYLQLGYRVTAASFNRALINNPEAALGLFYYFEARFNPKPEWVDPIIREEQALFPLRMQLLTQIDHVADVNDDRILRTLFNLIDATVRSNFHQRRACQDYFIAFKINSLGIIELPSPKPQFEIYVHAVDMEGIHLRSGKISRGGIRWSDRLDDFRTEILSLMQTQISKNALIIPTGAKGGFVVKDNGLHPDLKRAGQNAYLKLIRGMLDLTDNYVDGQIVSPTGIVAHDDPDPYLVVAADKGTAKFSDIANAVAAEYQFWLSDAFASGGSRGYDHKVLGITARGAWCCVQRHFLELGKNIQQSAFTVIGIGSMDGDVFGNGLLLSPYIRLVAAFSGQHIFIDPNPPEDDSAFNERKRLFDLAGSSWNDYNRSLISEGGGVYERTAKDIPVSVTLKKWLGIRYPSIDGESLIRHLLVAPVELLWLGGIGTYVKASTEKHEEVGDRSNDRVRVNAADLGAKVVGEGANLGFTQKARIEYQLRGGAINTDAVDNSAGVDTSDHEVNLKILLTALHRQGLIADYQTLFMDMTAAVSQLVLADNVAQSLCLSLEQLRSAEHSAHFLSLADRLEAAGFLDRAIDALATIKEIQARPNQRISRPELADLMAASKRYLTQKLQAQISSLQAECYDRYLAAYFPTQLRVSFQPYFAHHPLANEIKATVISNKIINQAGCRFLSLSIDTENGGILEAVNSYLAFDHIVDADAYRQAVAALDDQIAIKTQYQLLLQLELALEALCRWAIQHQNVLLPDAFTIDRYRGYFKAYAAYFEQHLLDEGGQAQLEHAQQIGIPAALALQSLLFDNARDFALAVKLATETQQDFVAILTMLQDISQALSLQPIQQTLSNISVRDRWERKVADDLQAELQHIAGQILKQMLVSEIVSATAYFETANIQPRMKIYQYIYQDIQVTAPQGLLPYVTVIRAMADLVAC